MASEPAPSRSAFRLRAPRWLAVFPTENQPLWPFLLAGLLAALLIVQLVRLLWTLVVPLGPVGGWQPPTAVIAPLAERQALFASFDAFFRSGPAQPGQATVTALGLVLFGINMNEATGGGSAIIAGEDGVQSSYAVGDEIAPGVKLAGVAFDYVLLDHGGARETLFLDQSKPAAVASPDAAGVGPSPLPSPTPEIGSAATTTLGELSPASIRAGIGFAPRTEGGRVTGLVVQSQGDGAAFRAAGLRPGDVIRSVNGRAIGSATDAAAIANQLTPGARLSFEVERGASTVPVALFLSKS